LESDPHRPLHMTNSRDGNQLTKQTNSFWLKRLYSARQQPFSGDAGAHDV
jgi:hypothetical protein